MDEKNFNTDVAIIGGGACGLMCGVSLIKNGFNGSCVIIESNPRVGKKLLATGNGRCNLSNENLSNKFYYGSGRDSACQLFNKYNSEYIKEYFEKMGLMTVSDHEGRIYPYSNSGSSVLDIMRLHLDHRVTEYCSCSVTKIIPNKNGYKLICNDSITFNAKKIVIACGGKASPKLSGDGMGYQLAKQLGYSLRSLMPSLAPVKVNSHVLRSIKGLRVQGSVALTADGKRVKSEQGEIQFGDGILSGICVFQLSRLVNEFFTSHTINGSKRNRIGITIDLFPAMDYSHVYSMVSARKNALSQHTADKLFTGVLQNRIAMAVLKESGISDLQIPIYSLNDRSIKAIADTLQQWSFTPRCVSDFNTAQVTAGGVDAKDMNFNTMEAVKHQG